MTENLMPWIASCVRRVGVAFAVSSVFAYGTMLARLNAYERACDEFGRSSIQSPTWGARTLDAVHPFSVDWSDRITDRSDRITDRSDRALHVDPHTTLAIRPSASSTFERPLNALNLM